MEGSEKESFRDDCHVVPRWVPAGIGVFGRRSPLAVNRRFTRRARLVLLGDGQYLPLVRLIEVVNIVLAGGGWRCGVAVGVWQGVRLLRDGRDPTEVSYLD